MLKKCTVMKSCLVFLIGWWLIPACVNAQVSRTEQANGPCVNMGFENGTFSGWTGMSYDRHPGNYNTDVRPLPTPVPGDFVNGFFQQCIMSAGMRDPYFPTQLNVLPPGKAHSVRLGNTVSGGHLATMKQTFFVDSSNLIFTYRYAVVLEDPKDAAGHDGLNSPHFKAALYDKDSNIISCAGYSVVVEKNLQSYTHACVRTPDVGNNQALRSANNYGCPSGSPDATEVNPAVSGVQLTDANCGNPPNGNQVMREFYFRNWTTVSIVLDKYLGQNVTIEFTAADCVPNGHLGYAYVHAECAPLELDSPGVICSGKEVKMIKAPKGFASYKWSTANGTVVGKTNGDTVFISKAGTYIVDMVTLSDVPCPYQLIYVVKDLCPPPAKMDTLCESSKGLRKATGVNLNSYTAKLTENGKWGTIVTWHTAKPVAANNRISNPNSYTVSDSQRIFALTNIGTRRDTLELDFYTRDLPLLQFPVIPSFCVGAPDYTIAGVTPMGGTFSGPRVTAGGIFSPTVPGIARVLYSYSDRFGCTDTLSRPALVVNKPLIEATGDTSVCFMNKNLTLHLAAKVQSGDSLSWTSVTGTIGNAKAASTNLTFTGTAPVDLNFKVYVAAFRKNCPVVRDSVTISLHQLPTVQAPSDTSLCTDTSPVKLIARGKANYQDRIHWSGTMFDNDASLLTPYSLNYYYPERKQHKLLLSAFKSSCPIVKDSFYVTLNPLPKVVAPPDSTYCEGVLAFTLNGKTTGTDSVLWRAINLNGNFVNPAAGVTVFTGKAVNAGLPSLFVLQGLTRTCGSVSDTAVFRSVVPPKLSLLPKLCYYKPIMITASVLNKPLEGDYAWYRNGVSLGEKLPSLLLSSSGTYSYQYEYKNCLVKSTLVATDPPVVSATHIKACENSMVTLEVTSVAGATYFWGGNPVGNLSATYPINSAKGVKNFPVIVEDQNGCRDTAAVSVQTYPNPAFSLVPEIGCPGETKLIKTILANPALADTFDLHFKWTQNGNVLSAATWKQISFSASGDYVLELGIEGCLVSHAVKAATYPNPDIVLEKNHRYCFETDAPVVLTSPLFAGYKWFSTDGLLDTVRTIRVAPQGDATYWLNVRNVFGCRDSTELHVRNICPPKLFVPNVITPHSKDVNSALKIFGRHYTNFEITIFNRWGEVIFNSKDPLVEWDGTYKNENMPIGNYPWLVTYEGDTQEYRGPYKLVGDVTLVR